MERRFRLVSCAVLMGFVAGLALPALAQDDAKALQTELRDAQNKLRMFERGQFESPEVAAAKAALAVAQKADQEKQQAKLMANAAAADLLKQKEAMQTQQKESDAKAKAAREKLEADAELVALKKAVTDAQTAYKTKYDEKAKASADIAGAVKASDEVRAKMAEADKKIIEIRLADNPDVGKLKSRIRELEDKIAAMKKAEDEKRAAAKKDKPKKEDKKPEPKTPDAKK